MPYKRKKGNRKKVSEAYFCKKLNLRIVQKITYCGEDAPDLCDGCKFREPFIASTEFFSNLRKNDLE